MDRHLARFRQSAESLVLPVPEASFVGAMVTSLIERCQAVVPEAPGALYLRPALIGTTANIGAAAAPSTEACLMVIASPVWDYFSGGAKPLKIWVEEQATRCASHLGSTKTGGNYAAALGPTMAARRAHQVDQVLFCPGGDVQETGAANFLLIREGHILTRNLDASFLHGVTRDSLLTMARDLGYRVEERAFNVDEMIDWVKTGEAALSGTAAVLAGVGSLQRAGQTIQVGDGQIGVHTQRLRSALVDIQQGRAPDRHGWLQTV
jgi:branched-chain amino acid aminotransferase